MSEILLKIYSIIFLSIATHELSHVLALKFFKKDFNKIYIGDNYLSFNLKKLCISPIPINSYIDINENEILKMNKIELIFFFFSGSFSNLLLLFIALFIGDPIISYPLFLLNLFLIVVNLNPISSKNDFGMFIHYIKLFK